LFRKLRGPHGGFTLVELLVVLAILAVLAGIAWPALQRASESAKFSKCAANLRLLGVGCLRFASDNNGALPHQDQGGPEGAKLQWGDVALGDGLITTQAKARSIACPCMAEPALNMWNALSSGYGYNPNIGTAAYYFTQQVKDGNSYPNVRLAWIKRPSQVILATDAGQNNEKASQEMFSMWSPYGCMRVRNGVWQLVPGRVNASQAEQPVDPQYFQDVKGGFEHRLPAWPFPQANGKVRAARHGGKVNCLFVDGHVEARRPEEILEKNVFWSY
jgi:prepilin-type N-terminal cleavage/methylation domain-containing protein/prepilin-type processing-associated H-X9-DG protein